MLAAVIGTESVLQIIHGASAPFVPGVFAPVVDAEHIFGVVGHHTEKGHDPHPEDSAGTAGDQRAGDTDDVACADGGSQCRTQGLELGNGLVILIGMFRDVFVNEDTADRISEPVPDMGQLEEFSQYSHQDTRTDKKYQHGNTPYKVVDGSVDTGNGIHEARKKITHTNLLLLFSQKAQT